MINVVLFGPPLSGKTTLLTELARARGAEVVSREGGSHATAPIHLAVNVPGAQVSTIPGAVWDDGDWDALLNDSHAIVAVFDLQRGREAEVTAARERIDGRTRVAVLTKSDLGNTFTREEAIGRYRLDGWQVFVSSLAAPAIEALEAAGV